MKLVVPILIGCAIAQITRADPSFECSIGSSSQVETGACVAMQLTQVDQTLIAALEFSKEAAQELDAITEREVSLPALLESQKAWETYRDAHCEFVGTTYGGGSGTGIAISSCRIKLGRARINELMKYNN